MELKGFRELLLKKLEITENSYLQDFVRYAKDDLIAERVLESLEKMAQPSAAMGRGANSALTAYGGQLTKTDIEQLKDALAHHISHYRGALKAGNRDAADKHLNKIIPLMHTIGRVSKHSGGKLALDYRSTTPWESNYTTLERHPHNNKLKEGTKDLGRRPKKTREGSSRGVPDYRYLEMPPHAGHADTGGLSLPESGYPFEEIQVGSPADIDAGKAWLPIEDVGDVKEFKPHPFDSHPVHQHADDPEHERSPEVKEKFAQDLAGWKNSEPHKEWLALQKQKYQQDPEGYKARGAQKPGHFWQDISLQAQPAHAKKQAAPISPVAVSDEPKQEGVDYSALPEALKQKFTSKGTQATPAQPAKAQTEPVQPAKAQAQPAKVDSQDDILAHIRSTLTPEHINKMTPEMKRILKIKG